MKNLNRYESQANMQTSSLKLPFLTNNKSTINLINDLQNKNINGKLKKQINNNNNQLNNQRINHEERTNRYKSQEKSIKIIKKIKLKEKNRANGLYNIETFPCINSILQCFAHIKILTQKLLSPDLKKKYKSAKPKYQLTSAYIEVLENIWENQNINPQCIHNFLNIFLNKEDKIKLTGINLKDFIKLLLDNLNKELSKSDIDKSINKNNGNFYSVDDINKMKLSNANLIRIIPDNFYGSQDSFILCSYCNYRINNNQSFNHLIFPIKEIFQYKREDIINIYDCLDYYQNPKNSFKFCIFCRQTTYFTECKKILYAPKILIIIFEWKNGLIKQNVKFEIEEKIDIRNYVTIRDSRPSFYELIGVVINIANSINPNYISICKSFRNKKWYKYNGSLAISLSSFSEVKKFKNPKILFYSSIM